MTVVCRTCSVLCTLFMNLSFFHVLRKGGKGERADRAARLIQYVALLDSGIYEEILDKLDTFAILRFGTCEHLCFALRAEMLQCLTQQRCWQFVEFCQGPIEAAVQGREGKVRTEKTHVREAQPSWLEPQRVDGSTYLVIPRARLGSVRRES